MQKHLLNLEKFNQDEILSILDLADDIKKNPEKYLEKLAQKTLLMIFEKPSLRTRISFEVGMTQMGGHAIYYDLSESVMGKKESVADTAKTVSRYADIVMARLFSQDVIKEFAEASSIPVINALTDKYHPCQILGDFETIREKKGSLKELKLSYFGDARNNITHSLLYGCAIMGIDIFVASPSGSEFEPDADVFKRALKLAERSGSRVISTQDPHEAAKDSDVVYTDSWMSYHIPESEKQERMKVFAEFQVNEAIMSEAKPDALFMHNLPAIRGMEMTAEVIDGPRSVVFDQAENRLHSQKAVMLKLLKIE